MKKTLRIFAITVIAISIFSRSFGDVANFIYSSACDGSAVVFTSTSTTSAGTIVSYEWDFDANGIFSDASGAVVTKLFAGPGAYPVGLRITSSLSVVSTIYKTITVNPLAVADFSVADVCSGQVGIFNSTSTISSGSIVKYKWDYNNDGIYDDSSGYSVSHFFPNPGSYMVGLQVISDSACVSVTSKSLRVNPLPVVDFNFDKTCLYDSTEILVSSTVQGGSIVKYYWNFDGDAIYEENSTVPYRKTKFIAAGNYNVAVKVESDKGCYKDTSKVIIVAPRPVLNFTFSNACVGSDIEIDNSFSSANTFLWDFGDGTGSTQKNPYHAYSASGNYDIHLFGSSVYGCSEHISKSISIHPVPSASFNAGNVCIGEWVHFSNLSVSNGVPIKDYYWDFDDNHGEINQNPKHLYLNPASYMVKLVVINMFDCRDTFHKQVDVYPLPKVDIIPGGPTEFCRNDSVELTVNTMGGTILWSTGENTASIIVRNSGKYRAVLFDSNACLNKDSIYIEVNELPEISVSPVDTQVSLGRSVDLTVWGANTYEWSPNKYLDNVFSANPTSQPLESITYLVTGEDMNGCKNNASLKIRVESDYVLNFTNLLTPNYDGANDVWDIGAKYYPDNEVIIYNRWGVEIFREKGYKDDWNAIYNGEELPEASYYYIVRFDNSPKVYSGYITVLR